MENMFEKDLEFEEDTQKNRYLTFSLEKETYGVEIKYVIEIIGIQTITEIPDLPEYIKGIINMRGKIIPVMDVRLRFKKDPLEYNDRTCVIIVDMNEILIGFIVDKVAEVVRIAEEDIIEPPKINKEIKNIYIKNIGRIGDNVKLLLDCEKLLTEDELEDLTEAL